MASTGSMPLPMHARGPGATGLGGGLLALDPPRASTNSEIDRGAEGWRSGDGRTPDPRSRTMTKLARQVTFADIGTLLVRSSRAASRRCRLRWTTSSRRHLDLALAGLRNDPTCSPRRAWSRQELEHTAARPARGRVEDRASVRPPCPSTAAVGGPAQLAASWSPALVRAHFGVEYLSPIPRRTRARIRG